MANSRDELEKQINPFGVMNRAIGEQEPGTQTAYPVSIFQIVPDPIQPRRLLPGALRYDRAIPDILGAWWDMAEEEAGTKIAVGNILKGYASERSADTAPESERRSGPIEAGFVKLVDLAATIRDKGLINPITIYRNGEGFRLETGERRWLAHHLLAAELGDPQWEKITAREVDAPSIWRQAHENTTRDDLNAISLARQLALLIMDIYTEMGLEFRFYNEFQHDRHFYAQVADGIQYPVAYGDRERVIAAMGKTSVSQVNQYRALLRLTDDIWQMADTHFWSERKLREYLQEIREFERQAAAKEVEQKSESITVVIDHNASTQEHEGDSDSHQDQVESVPGTDEQPAESLPANIEKLLYWAYKWSQRATSEPMSWFSANNAGTSPETLNRLVETGYLDWHKPMVDRYAANYRIAEKGVTAIGEEPLDYSFANQPQHVPPGADRPGFQGTQTRPTSEGEARSGPAPATSSTPPRRAATKLLTAEDNRHIDLLRALTDASIEMLSPTNRTYALEAVKQVRAALDRIEQRLLD